MTLPIIAVPTHELEIPSSKEKLTYRPFLVKEEKLLLLANESGEDQEIINAIKQIINNCTFDNIDIETLALFDLEYIFLNVRAKSVGEIVTLKLLCSDDKETYADVEIDLNDIKVNFPEGHTNKIELSDTVGILMRYPQFNLVRISQKGSDTEYIFKMIKECISTIYEGDTVFERSDFSDEDLDNFLDSLTSEHFKQLQGFFETMPKLTHDVKFKNPKTKKQNKMTLEGMQSFFV
jgi:hypothetical protein